MKITFDERARGEVEAVRAYYFEYASPMIAERWIDSVEHAGAQLTHYPTIGHSVSPRLRQLSLQKFPYSLIYRLDQERIVVIAVAAHRRKPGHWKNRQTGQ
ncbi:MAG: type II toxin-antitoxin system RelE/ParE family toxin [Betaproteobacteria bacterium]